MSTRSAHWLRWLARPLLAAALIPLGVAVGFGGLMEYWLRRCKERP